MPTDVQLLRKRAPMVPDSIKFSSSRRTILGAATASLMCSGHGARAQTVTAMGEVYINGQRATPGAVIRPGDRVLTGPESTLTLAIGEDAFRLRSLTSVEFGGTPDSTLVSGLRVLTGALLGAFRKSAPRQVQTATATIGIRGTAIYVEANPVLTYVCTCYGEVELECATYRSKKRVVARDHAPNYIFSRVLSGRSIVEAPVINHTNQELADIENLAGRPPMLPVKP